MVKLKNLMINEKGIVTGDIYPEDAKVPGQIKVSRDGLIDYTLPEGYEWCGNHLQHSEHFIISNYDKIRSGEIKEPLIMWC